MKKFSFFYCLLTVFVFDGFCQENALFQIKMTVEYDSLNNNRNLASDGINQAPLFKQGIHEIENYFRTNIKYSKGIYKTGLYGTNYLSITIGKNGEIRSAGVVKATVPERILVQLEKLILRCGDWYPAKKLGSEIETNILLVITFESHRVS